MCPQNSRTTEKPAFSKALDRRPMSPSGAGHRADAAPARLVRHVKDQAWIAGAPT
jgi:hypothetical protein